MRILPVLAVLVAVARSQEPLRERALGEVRGLDNQPFANATVHLLHRACASVLDARYEDLVEVTADAQGRFRAQVLAGMPYAVWATGPVVDGTYRCTKVETGVVPGVVVVLREDELHFARRCKVTVDPSWPALQLAASASIGGMLVRQPLTATDGVLSTPAWPVTSCAVAAFAGDLQVSTSWLPVTLGSQREAATRETKEGTAPPDEAQLSKLLAEPASFTVAARQEYAVRLVGPDQKPAAGVAIYSEVRQAQVRLGTTDNDGVLRVATAAAGALPFYETVGWGEGVAEARVDQESFRKAGDPLQTVALLAGSTVRGRLLFGEDRPADRVVLLLNGSITLGKNSTYFGIPERALATADDGTFSIPGRVKGYQFRVTALLTPAQRMALSERDAPPLWPRALVRVERATDAAELGDIRLDRLAKVDVHVASADGTPPGSVQLVVLPLSAQTMGSRPHYPERMRTDRHGALRFLIEPDAEAAVFAVSANGAAVAVTNADSRKLELSLDPRHVVRLRVVDRDGKPMTGVYVSIVSPTAAGLQGDAARVASRVRETMSVHGFPFKNTRTDADGQATLIAPQLDVVLDIVFDATVDAGKRVSMRLDIPLPADHAATPTEIEFVPNNR